METNFEACLRSASPAGAESIFSQDFATRAFEIGAHQPRGPAAKGQRGDRLPLDFTRWIVSDGRPSLARACFAYFLTVERRLGTQDLLPFVDLLRQIRNSASQISKAANGLAHQIARHYGETQECDGSGEVDHVRFRSLTYLASSLHKALSEDINKKRFAELMTPVITLEEGFGYQVSHGLDSCSNLATAADELLQKYKRYAAAMREAGMPALQGITGNRDDKDRNAFILELSRIFELAYHRPARGNRGSDATVGAESPFARFVRRVFEELQDQSCARQLSSQYKMPSVDVINRILRKERQARENRPETQEKR